MYDITVFLKIYSTYSRLVYEASYANRNLKEFIMAKIYVNGAWKELGGTQGEPGTTFTPEVSPDGDLSWTNDGNKQNPEPVNIKGPKGESSASFCVFKQTTDAASSTGVVQIVNPDGSLGGTVDVTYGFDIVEE